MGGNFGILLSIVFVVLLLNFVFWHRRHRKSLKPVKKATTEERARVIRHNEIQRRFEREQEDAIKYIELRNKTLALYDQVRKKAEASERKAAKEEAAQTNKAEDETQ